MCGIKRERKKFFSVKVRVRAKIDELAIFPRSLCATFVKIFVTEKLSLKSPVQSKTVGSTVSSSFDFLLIAFKFLLMEVELELLFCLFVQFITAQFITFLSIK